MRPIPPARSAGWQYHARALKRPLVLHPLLFAALPILFLYAYNVRQVLIAPSDVVLPLLVSVGLTALLWLLLWLVFRSVVKSGLLTTAAVAAFFLFGHIYDLLNNTWSGLRRWQLAGLLLVLLGLATWRVVRTRRALARSTLVLNLMAAALVLMNLVSGIPGYLQNRRAMVRPKPEAVAAEGLYPDIYHIILDGHARTDILAKLYGYDNRWFIDSLRRRGFYVADRGRANYSQTYLSLASTLNMTYLDSLVQAVGVKSQDHRPFVRYLLSNRAMRELRNRGYRTVTFASGYSGTEFSEADIHLSPGWTPSEFLFVLLANTALSPGLLRDLGLNYWADAHRRRVDYALQHLPDASRVDGPALVFAHLLSPHPPFVFGPGGEAVRSSNPSTLIDGDFYHSHKPALVREYVDGYRGQVEYIDRAILRTIDEILRRSGSPPVIILQGDHGPGSQLSMTNPQQTCFPERMSILYGVLMPDRDYSMWYDSITPVNTYGLVFNRLFGDTVAPRPDRSYFATWDSPYVFYDVDTCRPPVR
jgi:hypothetical protein